MDKLQPLISLIIPVYNAADTLSYTFDSVLNQSIGFENIQIILVDDSSTDQSPEICRRYAEQYHNVVALKTQSNSGTAGAPRNMGLDRATAPYLMFVDNDDALTQDACRILYNRIKGSDLDIVSGTCRESNPGVYKRGDFLYDIYDTHLHPAGIFEISTLNPGNHEAFFYNFWTKIYRRDIVERYHLRFAESLLWEDLYFLFLYLSVSKKGEAVHQDIYLYTTRSESLSRNNKEFYFTTIPQAILMGFNKAREMSSLSLFTRMLEYCNIIDNYTDLLIREKDLSNDELSRCLLAWRELLAYVYDNLISVHSAYSQIISRDMAQCDDNRVLYDFYALRDLSTQRNCQLDDIFNSRSWKLACRIQRVAAVLRPSNWRRIR